LTSIATRRYDSRSRFRQSVKEFRRSRNIDLERRFGDLGILHVSCTSRQFVTGSQREHVAVRGRIAADAGGGVATFIWGAVSGGEGRRLKTVSLEGRQQSFDHAEKRIDRPGADACRASPGIVPRLAQFQFNLGTLTGLLPSACAIR